MMTIENDVIIPLVPMGGNYHGSYVLDENDRVTVVEYDIEGEPRRLLFDKIEITPFFKTPTIIPVEETITKNEVYDFLNRKYNLGLVKGLDYLDSDELLSPSYLTDSMVIERKSLGYYGSIPVLITSVKNNLTVNGKIRDVRLADVGNKMIVSKIRLRLGWKVFETKGKLFNGYMLSVRLRELLKDHLSQFDEEDVEDVLQGHVEKTFNDGLSDVVLLRTPKARLYPIRFSASLGDLPKVME